MKVTSKREYDAEPFDGTPEALVKILKTFPGGVFKVCMQFGKVDVKYLVGTTWFVLVPGRYLVEEDEGYAAYSKEDFIKLYETDPVEGADQKVNPYKEGGFVQKVDIERDRPLENWF